MRLVSAARDAGLPVTVLPGPSAVETALVASGFAFDRYRFLGYLPRGERALGSLLAAVEASPDAAVAFESPQRLPTTLASMARAMPDRPLAVCRELTKAFEEVVRGPAQSVAERFSTAPKGEITLVIAPAPPRVAPDRLAIEAVAELVDAGVGRRDAANLVARLTGVSANGLYRGSLDLV
jgi:16S rRNA (cytidine1402-2'-O)-methyltransferase